MSEMLEPSPSLVEWLTEVPDARDRHRQRHPLAAALGSKVVALPAGSRAPESMADFGWDRGWTLLRPLRRL